MRILTYALLFLMVGVYTGFSQETPEQEETPKFLTVGDAISIALEKSYEMKVARLDRLSAEKNLVSAKSNFKMRIDANFELPNASEQVREIQVPNQLPFFNTTGELRYQGNLFFTQPLPTNGRFRLAGRTYYRDVSTWSEQNKLSSSRYDVLTSFSLDFQQPLFTLNELKTNLKQANLSYESAVQRYNRDELDIVYNVTAAFYSVYRATRELEIAREDVQQQQEIYQLAKQKYEAGLIPEVEALQMQVDYAESQAAFVEAEEALSRLSDAFKQLIGLKLTDNINVMTEFEYSHIEVDLQQAIELAKEQRSEIRLNEIDVELAKLRVKEIDAFRDFQGTLTAFYDLTGVASSDVWGTSDYTELWDRSLDDMQGRPDNRGVVFTLSVPIWDFGGNRAAVQSAQANVNANELALMEMKKTIEREVRQVVGRLRAAETQLTVLEQREEIAKRAFDITVERFNNGDITSQELALDRGRYIAAQLAYLNAYINYQLALADLKRKTMYDFEYGQSLVE